MADLTYETAVHQETDTTLIAGLDEAGRGALAGPVVAAAVILPLHDAKKMKTLAAVNDSKQVTAGQRESQYEQIIDKALAYGLGQTAAAVIDEIGIIQATKQAMRTALTQLQPAAEYLLIDGRIRLKTIPLPQQSIIRGDSHSLSIAAASILAKVTRDRLMITHHDTYPHYGFARHKGYGTPFHLEALTTHGPCPLHRYSFAPIRKPLIEQPKE